MEQDQTLSSNIWKLGLDRFILAAWLYVPVLVPFYEANGLSATEVFSIQGAFSFALVLFEIPTGYFSDVVGRRVAMAIGAAFLPLGTLVYALTHGFWGFVWAEVIIAAGIALRSGTDTSLLYDTLVALEREKEHKRLEGLCLFAEGMGVAISSIMGGLLANISLLTPFWATIPTMALLLPLSLSMKEPPRPPPARKKPREHAAALARAASYCLSHSEIRSAAIYAATLIGTAIVGLWSYYLFYGRMNVPVGAYGFLAAAGNLMYALGGRVAHRVEKKFGQARAFLLPLLIAPSFLALGLLHNGAAFAFIFLNGFLWGFFIPLLRDYVHKRAPTALRATIFSAIAMGERIVYVILALIVGWLTDAFSLGAAHVFLGIVFALGAGCGVWGMKKGVRHGTKR